MSTTQDLEERYLDSHLRDTLSDTSAPDLSQTIRHANQAEREAARQIVLAASNFRRGRSHAYLLQAAVLLLGLTAVWAIWTMGQEQDNRVAAGDDTTFVDSAQDPNRITPRNPAELRDLLDLTESAKIRCCYSTIHYGGDQVRVNLDLGSKSYIQLPKPEQDALIDVLKTASKARTVTPRADFSPAVRIVFTLKNGRTLHVLAEYSTSFRAIDGQDFPVRQGSIANLTSGHLGDSSDRAYQELGIAFQSLTTRMTTPDGDQFFLSSELESLQCFGISPLDLGAGIGRFQRLRSLDITHSATQLASGATLQDSWTAPSLSVMAELKVLRGHNLTMTDAALDTLLTQTPKLQSLDLAGCTNVRGKTLRRALSMASLRRIDFRGSLLSMAQLSAAATQSRLPADAVVTLTKPASISPQEQRQLEDGLPFAVEWH